MSTFTVMILMALFSLALAHVPEVSSLSATSFIVTPVQDPRLTSFFPWLRPTQPPVSEAATRRDDYTYTSGISGYKIHTRALSWNKARLTCEEEGGYLAIINSIAEAYTITSLFAKAEPITGTPYPDYIFLGFHDLYKEGQFVTIHGDPIEKTGYNDWAVGQPSGGIQENCGCFYKEGRLYDISCAAKCGFVCEKPIVN